MTHKKVTLIEILEEKDTPLDEPDKELDQMPDKPQPSNYGWKVAVGSIAGIALVLFGALVSSIRKNESPTPTITSVVEATQPYSTESTVKLTTSPFYTSTHIPTKTPVPLGPTRTVNPDWVTWLWGDILDESSESIGIGDGDKLFLGASSYILDDRQCYQDDNRICVYIKEGSRQELVTLWGYTPGHAWAGVANAYSVEAVIKDKSPQFWFAPNCETGCGHAMLIIDYKDGCREQFVLYPDDSREYYGEKCNN